jgi:hypothetical protein
VGQAPEKEQNPLPCAGRSVDPSLKHRTRGVHGGCFGVSGTPPCKPSLLQMVESKTGLVRVSFLDVLADFHRVTVAFALAPLRVETFSGPSPPGNKQVVWSQFEGASLNSKGGLG